MRKLKGDHGFMRVAVRAAALLAILAGIGPGLAHAQAQEKSTPMSQVQRLNRAPVNKEILRVQLPRPTIVKLPNGLTLILIEDHKLPTVDFTMWITPGQMGDPADLPGLATFTADMLREGTARRSSTQLAAEADSLGATLNANAAFGESYTAVNASGLIGDSEKILDLMSDVALHPAFAPDELALYKRREEAALEQRRTNPAFLAFEAMNRALYVEGPLSVTAPSKESVERVTPADLKKYHDQHYVPGNALFGAIGDFHTDDMRALIARQFGAWAGAAEAPMSAPKMAPTPAAKITLVDRPGSVQTFLLAADRTIPRTNPDFYALEVMNQVLGGGPQSRLFLDLREEHSYTYGAYSGVSAEAFTGDWDANAAVRTPVTDGSMDRFTFEFKRIRDEAVPASELDDARRAIVAGFALSLERPAQLLNNILEVQHFGLPADYWDKYPDRIAAVDSAQVQAAAKKYIDLAHLQWVAVGDAKQIHDAMAKYGPVSAIDAEGKPQN
jgi:zinc protease